MSIPDILASGGLDTPAEHLSEAEAQKIARASYGLNGTFTRFATEKDDTFRILTQDGKGYVLKIANPAENELEIDLQIEVLKHLQQKQPDLNVPRVLQDKSGNWSFHYEASDGSTRLVRLLTYMDGIPLDTTTASQSERIKIGHILGRLRLALTDFNHPGKTRKLAWDIQHLPELEPLLDEIENPDHKKLLSEGFEKFLVIVPELQQLRRQVLHNDFSRSNLVVDHGNVDFVTGIIDFGDVVETAVAIDVSTAMLNQLPRTVETDPFAPCRDILQGYIEVADLTDQEHALLPHLVMGRVITRALLSLWRARIFPQNAEYILRNTEQGWWQLKWFLSRPHNELTEMLLKK